MLNGYLVVKGGDSRFLTNHFESSIVDNESETRFSYLPLHPPFSNPKLQQRYLVSVYKQPDNFKLNPLSLNFGVESSKDNQTNDLLEYNARRIGSSFRFQQLNQLELLGVGAFTSGNTVETGRIFESLGLHEQVFGKLVGNPRKLVEKIQSTQIGAEKFKPFTKIPTLNEQRIPAYDGFQVEKRKSLGIIARVAMVKNRPSDIASKHTGEISERVNVRRNRFQYA